ncbi:MAG: hypothetical protein MJ182_10785 [Treponema sp.]|nr:hypothetical protein [Treponema sp.]
MESVKQMMDGHIDHLTKETELLKNRLEILYDMTKGKSRVYVDSVKLDEVFHQAEEIAREMVSLKSANEILYKNRGKASPKKAVSSKANGKFGGRPPREIAEKKRRIQELDNKTFVLHECLTAEERKEYDELSFDVIAWENKKKDKILEEQENLN